MFAATALKRAFSALPRGSRSSRRYSTRLEDEGGELLGHRVANHAYRIDPDRPPPDAEPANRAAPSSAPEVAIPVSRLLRDPWLFESTLGAIGTAWWTFAAPRPGNGQPLLDSRVQDLVNAMAGFAPPAAGQTEMPAGYRPTLIPFIVADSGP